MHKEDVDNWDGDDVSADDDSGDGNRSDNDEDVYSNIDESLGNYNKIGNDKRGRNKHAHGNPNNCCNENEDAAIDIPNNADDNDKCYKVSIGYLLSSNKQENGCCEPDMSSETGTQNLGNTNDSDDSDDDKENSNGVHDCGCCEDNKNKHINAEKYYMRTTGLIIP